MKQPRAKRHNTEIYGLALILVAVISLSGLLLSPSLGAAGKAVQQFIIGVFGLSSYALFTALLAWGIALFNNYTLQVSPKRVICVAGMFLFAILILHCISSFRYIDKTTKFSEYLFQCYDKGQSFGGIIMGVIVFPLHRALTDVGTYIMLSIMFVVFLLGFIDFSAIRKSRATKKIIAAQQKQNMVTAPASAAQKNQVSLPLFNIQSKKSSKTKEGVVSEMPGGKAAEGGTKRIEGLKTVFYNIQSTQKNAENAAVASGGAAALDTLDSNIYKGISATYTREQAVPEQNKPVSSVTGFITSTKSQSGFIRPPKIVHEEKTDSVPNWTPPKIIDLETRAREIAARKSKEAELAKPKEEKREEDPFIKSFKEKLRPGYIPKIINAEEASQKLKESRISGKPEAIDKFKEYLSSKYNTPQETAEQESAIEEVKTDEQNAQAIHENNDIAAAQNKDDFDPEKDYTGYYRVIKPQPSKLDQSISQIEGVRPSQISSKRVDENQIPLEDYIQETAKPKIIKPGRKSYKYVYPPIDLLQNNSTYTGKIDERAHDRAALLEQVLEEFRTPAKVIGITKGPAVTRYELQMPPGISVKKIADKADDIAYTMAASGGIRIETPIPGKQAVGIEIPNEVIDKVSLREIIESREFAQSTSPLTFALGKDISGKSVVCDLIKMPHLLVAGATNSGKSSCLNSLIASMLYRSSPEDLRFILIDPKRVEFSVFAGLPHLLIKDPITEPDVALRVFDWAIEESENRFGLFATLKVRDIREYNQTEAVLSGEREKLPYIVIVVDELADLMLQAKRDFEDRIRAVAQKSRAAGLHLVIATQRPSVDIITGTIKANLPSRIAFAVTSFADSKTILDQGGAEKLLGSGDMLYAPVDRAEPIRIQGAYVTGSDLLDVVNYVKEKNPAIFDHELEEKIYKTKDENNLGMDELFEDEDPNLPYILKMFIDSGQASTSAIQRRFRYGYAKAARIMDYLEQKKFISPFDGTNKPRRVLITYDEFKELYGDIE